MQCIALYLISYQNPLHVWTVVNHLWPIFLIHPSKWNGRNFDPPHSGTSINQTRWDLFLIYGSDLDFFFTSTRRVLVLVVVVVVVVVGGGGGGGVPFSSCVCCCCWRCSFPMFILILLSSWGFHGGFFWLHISGQFRSPSFQMVFSKCPFLILTWSFQSIFQFDEHIQLVLTPTAHFLAFFFKQVKGLSMFTPTSQAWRRGSTNLGS